MSRPTLRLAPAAFQRLCRPPARAFRDTLTESMRKVLAPQITRQCMPSLQCARQLCSNASATTDLLTLPSGLKYRDVYTPDDSKVVAEANHHVTVHYTGRLDDGTIFDSSYARGTPITFQLGTRQVIKGWEQGIPGMLVGGKRQLVIPPHLAYGAAGAPPAIPPNALLHFDVELVSSTGSTGWFGRLTTLMKAFPFK
ncbi:hypothetical protein AB1Y20_021007 [Prymnesium parvum]|uniref:peptidylprolyl isomerase n=1 Tax=Prymnesium parvum TaxID=97485 RepID=A0AB34JH55_PRYPA